MNSPRPAADSVPSSDPIPDAGAETPEVSVVIPCLNEERTVGRCVREAWEGIRAAGVVGEVIVADNGSTDRSKERAREAGARVVEVSRRGYGAALQEGFLAARGRLLVMGDADMSYDFRHIPRFVEEQHRSGADLVVGNRFRGGIRPGAMPLSHRLLGNPLITWVLRHFFGPPLGDCYCGLRMITRQAHRRLRLDATGMEYALEMIVQAALAGMRMAEVPTTLRVDGRDVPPHLKTMRDGYRSFRFLFQHSPITLYLWPGVLLILGGAAALGHEALRELRAAAPAAWGLSIASATVLILGWLMILLGLIARMFAAGYLDSRVDPFLQRFFARFRLEHGIALAVLGLGAGTGSLLYGAGHSPALALLGMAGLVISFGTFFGVFVVSLMGRAVPDRRFHLDAALGRRARKPRFSYRGLMPRGDDATGQNLAHSLHTQKVLAGANNYNRWIVESIAPALQNARTVLDVGCSIGNITGVVADTLAGGPEPTRVVGLDIVPAAVEEFRRRFGAREDMKIVGGDLFSDPPAPELSALAPFDAVVSCNVLEHLEDDIAALERMGSLLKAGGRLGLFVPGGGERLYGTLDALDRHYRRYTPARLAERLEQAGFEVETIRKVNFAGYFLWFWQGRVRKARRFNTGSVKMIDRLVPVFRLLDRLLGPPMGQSLAVVARWKPRGK
jgi:glycosyltransferase involved in cell wall biosynthesis/SAM-dependent methyltransferase